MRMNRTRVSISLPTSSLTLTEDRLAVQDMEIIMHAGCQQQLLMGWMPLKPPHSTTHGILTEWLPHISAIPQQYLLIIAAERSTRQKNWAESQFFPHLLQAKCLKESSRMPYGLLGGVANAAQNKSTDDCVRCPWLNKGLKIKKKKRDTYSPCSTADGDRVNK